jgi:hypothetical protein
MIQHQWLDLREVRRHEVLCSVGITDFDRVSDLLVSGDHARP